MRQDKSNRILALANWHRGSVTDDHVLRTVLTGDIPSLPARIIAQVANIRHAAYQEGREAMRVAMGGLDGADGCVFTETNLIPAEAIKRIVVERTEERKIVPCTNPSHHYNYRQIYRDAEGKDRIIDRVEAMDLKECWMEEKKTIVTYKLDYREEF